ncbi:MAG: hypothetical protein ABEH64_03980 [Salinirussus sp.]
MTDDRSERLRRRRKRAAEGRPSEDPPSRATDTEREESGSVKDRQTGTYMYLPEAQVKDLRRVYNILKAEYEYEYDAAFEKNRHFYPLVVRYGLDRLEDMDATEVRDRLNDLP